MKTVGDRLRLAREQAGLSQAQVARLLDLHRPTVSEIEAGRRRVTAEELTAFAKTYEVSVGWLSGEESETAGIDDRVLLAARELAKLRPDDLESVMRLLATMRRKPTRKR
jgi:transcriptional regulator with XRE-family HTH domain